MKRGKKISRSRVSLEILLNAPASDKQKQLMVVSMIAVPLNVILNLVLIPHYKSQFGNGGIGTALATSPTEFCIMIAVVSLLPKGILREFRFSVILKSFLAG